MTKKIKTTNKDLFGKKTTIVHDGSIDISADGTAEVSEKVHAELVGKGNWIDHPDNTPTKTKKKAAAPTQENEEEHQGDEIEEEEKLPLTDAEIKAMKQELFKKEVPDLQQFAAKLGFADSKEKNKVKLVNYIVSKS